MPEQLDRLVPLYRRSGVRLLLHGHEHNFQHGQVDGLDYVIAGGGAKLDERTPIRFEEAGTQSWAAAPHCLLVQVLPDRLIVVPYGPTPPGAQPVPIARRRPDGSVTQEPITIPLR
jgi:tartrate-resistant acid phosphatase type 5